MLSNRFMNFLNLFFDIEIEKKHKVLPIIWIFLIYLFGILAWGYLFNWRQTPINYHDWAEINLPRVQVVKEALLNQVLPLHVNDTSMLHHLTDRFLTLPDIITTPQMVLLWFMDADTFLLTDLLLHYSIATLGLFFFKRKFNWSIFTFVVLFFLFNFNGYIIAHYLVGHATWAGYFLFPWFFLFVFEFVESQPNWRWVTKVAFLCFYMVLAGSQHHFTWLLLFLGFLGLAEWRKLKWIAAAIFSAGFLSAFRLLPPILIIENVKDRLNFSFLTGYQSLAELISALVNIKKPDDYIFFVSSHPLGYWEFNYFIGILGFFFLCIFGIFFWLRNEQNDQRFHVLFFPFFMTLFMSIGLIYGETLYHLPVFRSERVISRMVSIPITMLMFVAAIFFDKWFQQKTIKMRWLFGAGLILLVNDLREHMRVWNIQNIVPEFAQVELQFAKIMLNNHPDPTYFQILLLGLLLTILTALTLTLLVLRTRKVR